MQTTTHTFAGRAFGALVCGVLAGTLLPNSMQVGLQFTVGGSEDTSAWSGMFWGEHWVVRALASIVSTGVAGFLTGVVARRYGRRLAAIASVPSFVIWSYLAFSAWSGSTPLLGGFEVDLSLGNKLMATVLAVLTVPLAAAGGEHGEVLVDQVGDHFDARRKTLLGVRWYHYLWIPIVLHLMIAQTFWAGLYGLQWVVVAWRAGQSMMSLVPMAFMLGIWASLWLTWMGASRAYAALAGFEAYSSSSTVAKLVIKNALGLPLLAALIQAGITLLHFGLAKLSS